MHEDQTAVEIRLRDGRVLACRVDNAIGSLARPLSDADIERKFRGLAQDILPPAQIDRLVGLAWKVGALSSADEVAKAAAAA